MKIKGLAKLIFTDWQMFRNKRRRNIIDEVKNNFEKYKTDPLYRRRAWKILEEKISSEGNFSW